MSNVVFVRFVRGAFPILFFAAAMLFGGFASLKAEDSATSDKEVGSVRIELPAATAKLSGPGVQLHAENKLAVRWTEPSDRAEWTFNIPRAGVFDLLMRWQVERAQAGQPFVIEVDGEDAILAEVPTTDGRAAPEERPFGQLELTAGAHRLAVRPAMKVEGELFELHSFTLAPGGGRKSAPPMSVPDGFEMEMVAGAPMVKHPMMACFDDRGRLFIAESAGINRKAAELLETRPHSILMLEDLDGDGRFDRRTVFADGMVLPNGAQWFNGALYVCSPPFLWRLEDTDDDGRADKRERIVGRFEFSGMSDSMHGPVLGPDGRFYFCGGQHGWVLCEPDSDAPIASEVPGAFSCWPDGSDPEAVGHGGTANPVEVTFTPEGEVMGTLAILDGVDGRHDALLHWIYGGIYNIREEYRDKVRRTGDLLSAFGRRGHVAPAGIMRYRGTAFGPEYRDNLFLCEFNTHKVFRARLERDGATFRRTEEVFLSSTDNDVHFTDVLEDADGSLIVLETGGWFRFGCPTSQVAKSHILGGIYRIKKTGAAADADPRGLAIDWQAAANNTLCELLDDARFPVRDRAIATLALRGEGAIGNLESKLDAPSEVTRRNAIWALTRIEGDAARGAVRRALQDKSASVRLTATRSVSTRRDGRAVSRLVELLADDSPPIRREAATALGRIGSREAVSALLSGLQDPFDRFHEHALIYALIQIGDRDATLAGLDAGAPQVRRGAVIALDQMGGGELARDEVAKLLDTDDPALQRTVLEILGRQPGWTDEIALLAGRWIEDENLGSDRQASLRGVLAAYAGDAKIQQLMADALASGETSAETRLLLLDSMARSELNPVPETWRACLTAATESAEPRILSQAVATASALAAGDFREAFVRIARGDALPVDVRIAAMSAAAATSQPLESDLFDLAVAQCSNGDDPVLRLTAARALGGAVLSGPQRLRVIELIAHAGPVELPSLIAAFDAPSPNADEGVALVRSLEQSAGGESLTLPRVEAIVDRFPPAVRAAAGGLLDRLHAAALEQQTRLATLEAELGDGDAAHGRELFFGARASCAACHQIQREGGQVGPDLSHIGEIRSRRDLLEAIAFPSASFARGYEPMTIVTTDGKAHSGIIARETGTAVYVRTAERAEIRLAREDIEQLVPSKTSIMPQGLDRHLGPKELSDVIAFLQGLK